jgi:sporulation protein YlmC with PRC-barrel domain
MKYVALLFLSTLLGVSLASAGASQAGTVLIPASYTNTVEKNWRQQKNTEIQEAVIYHDLRNGMVPDRTVSSAGLENRYSSAGLIGAYVYTRDNTRIARIEDVILDQFGNAQKIVLKGEWPYDLEGNPVMLGYEEVIDVNATANEPSVVKAVSVDQLKAAPIYNGAVGNGEATASFFPGAEVKDNAGDPVARVENISFSRNTEAYFILSYGQGGDSGQALMAYKDVQKIFPGKGVYLQLTGEQTDFFKKYLLKTYTAPQNITAIPR